MNRRSFIGLAGAAAQTVVPGRIVTVTPLAHCDFIMLNSLKGDNDGKDRGPEFRQRMMQGIKGQKCFFTFG